MVGWAMTGWGMAVWGYGGGGCCWATAWETLLFICTTTDGSVFPAACTIWAGFFCENRERGPLCTTMDEWN